MKPTNYELIRRGLELLREGLRPFFEKEMREVYGDAWQEEGRSVLRTPSFAKLNWDAQALLKAIDGKWNEVFRKKLEKRKHRSWIIEARELRDDFAHQKPFPNEDTLRGLDTIEFLLAAVCAPESREVALLKRDVGEGISAPLVDTEVRAATSRIPVVHRIKMDSEFNVLPIDLVPPVGGPATRNGVNHEGSTIRVDDRVIAISINEQYKHCKEAAELYTCTRGLWRLKKERADNAKYAFATYQGVVKEVYEIDKWLPATKAFSDFWVEKLRSQGRIISADEHVGRCEFVGQVAPEPIRKKYIGRVIPTRHKGNPILYFNC